MTNKIKPKEKPLDPAYMPLVRQALEALQSLNPVERAVLGLRFGLDGGLEQDLEAVARHYGVSPEIIAGVEIDALRKLRHHQCYRQKPTQRRARAKREGQRAHLSIVENEIQVESETRQNKPKPAI